MSTGRAAFILACCLLIACAHSSANHTVEIRSDGVLQPGSKVIVRVAVPGDWNATYPVVQGRAVGAYKGPDNYTSMAIAVIRAGISTEHCPAAAWGAASDAVAAAVAMTGSITFTSRPLIFDQYLWSRTSASLPDPAAFNPRLAPVPGAPEVVDYGFDRLTPPSLSPSPEDRFVIGRVMCREGYVAIVSCSGGVARRKSMGSVCEQIAGSLSIELEGSGLPSDDPVSIARASQPPRSSSEPREL